MNSFLGLSSIGAERRGSERLAYPLDRRNLARRNRVVKFLLSVLLSPHMLLICPVLCLIYRSA